MEENPRLVMDAYVSYKDRLERERSSTNDGVNFQKDCVDVPEGFLPENH